MKQKQKIILAHLNGVNDREIARSMHMSKDTINKYVKEYDEKKVELLVLDPSMKPSEIYRLLWKSQSMTTGIVVLKNPQKKP